MTRPATGGPWPRSIPGEITRYVLSPGLAGALAGLAAVAGLLVVDVGSLRTLMFASPAGWGAAGLLAFGFMSGFAAAAIGAAIMTIGDDDPAERSV